MLAKHLLFLMAPTPNCSAVTHWRSLRENQLNEFTVRSWSGIKKGLCYIGSAQMMLKYQAVFLFYFHLIFLLSTYVQFVGKAETLLYWTASHMHPKTRTNMQPDHTYTPLMQYCIKSCPIISQQVWLNSCHLPGQGHNAHNTRTAWCVSLGHGM